MSIVDLHLDKAKTYDAFIQLIDADEPEELEFAQNGKAGYVDFYPKNAGFTKDGSFDAGLWEEERHGVHLLFRPTKRGYRDAIVNLKNQEAPVDLIDLSDGCGFAIFEQRLRSISGKANPARS